MIVFPFSVGTRAARTGVCISIILSIFPQMTGCWVLLTYTTAFFEEAGSSFTPLQSSLLICIFQIVANICTMFLVDRLGRKILLTTSSVGAGIGLMILALHHLYRDDLPNSNWLPMYMLTLTLFIAQVGILSIPSIITIDILPAKVSNCWI